MKITPDRFQERILRFHPLPDYKGKIGLGLGVGDLRVSLEADKR